MRGLEDFHSVTFTLAISHTTCLSKSLAIDWPVSALLITSCARTCMYWARIPHHLTPVTKHEGALTLLFGRINCT